MDGLSPTEIARRAGDLAGQALAPMIERHFPDPSRGATWPDVYRQWDVTNGRAPRTYAVSDPRFVLLLLVREWKSFPGLTPLQSGYAREARSTLNQAAHGSEVTVEGCTRLIDTLALLLDSLGLLEAADEVRALSRLLPASPGDPAEEQFFDEDETPAPVLDAATRVEVDPEPSNDDLDAGLMRTTVRLRGVEITVDYVEAISYALVVNGISPVRRLRIVNTAEEARTVDSVNVGLTANGALLEIPLGLPVEPESAHVVDPSALIWPLDPIAFASLDENLPTTVTLVATVEGRRAVASGRSTVLAHDEWQPAGLPEVLASFVTPNNPAVAAIVESVPRFDSGDGDLALNGYQDGPEHAERVATAAFAAVAGLGLKARPDAGDRNSRQIRRPDEVITSGWAHPLELAVIYCAVLEGCGIHPLIALAGRDVIVGFLRDDVALPELVTTAPEQIFTIARSGFLVAADAGQLTRGRSLDDAARAVAHYWDQNLAKVDFLLDVSAARRRVKPMPVILKDEDGVVVTVEREAARPVPTLKARPTAAKTSEMQFHPRVQQWRRSLLDLSFRNPLLKLKAGTGLKLVIPERSIAGVEDGLASGLSYTIVDGRSLPEIYQAQGLRLASEIPEREIADVLANERRIYALTARGAVPTRLDTLRRQAAAMREETGANTLFLTLGALRFTDAKGSEGLAPLFLLPARLVGRKGATYTLQVPDEEEALPNYCLIEKLRREHGLTISALETPPTDDAGIDIDEVFRQVRQECVRRGLSFSVEPEFRVAPLQFATLEMWRDVSENWEHFLDNPVVHHLVHTPMDTFTDPVPEPELARDEEATAHLPVLSDGAQLRAIRWAREGRTFVLQGPPGTGKSQTITNMIADALAAGRTVLFVAEKAAALDVVQRRLNDAGLGPLTLELHGRQQTIRGAREQLAAAWKAASGPLPSTYDHARSAHLRLVNELDSYPQLLDKRGPNGLSLRQAYDRRSTLRATVTRPDKGQPPIAVPPSVVAGYVPVAEVVAACDHVERSQSVLPEPVSRSVWSLVGPSQEDDDTQAIFGALTDLDRSRENLADRVRRLVVDLTDPHAYAAVIEWLQSVAHGSQLRADQLDPDGSARSLADRVDNAMTALAAYRTKNDWFLRETHPTALHADVPQLRARLVAARQQTTWLKRRVKAVAAAEAEIRSLVQRPESIASDKIDVFLSDLAAFQYRTQELHAYLGQVVPTHVADPTQAQADAALGDLRERAAEWQRLRDAMPDPRRCSDYLDQFRAGAADPSGDADALGRFVDSWEAFTAALGATPATVASWQADRSLVDAVDSSLTAWKAAAARGLGAVSRLRRARVDLDRLAGLGLGDVVRELESGARSAEGLGGSVELAIADMALAERLDATALDVFSATARDAKIGEFINAAQAVRTRATIGIPALVRAQRGVDTSKPSSALAALRREFERKRGGSIRELLTRHGDALLMLTPCLLMSPQSVARFLPVGSVTFDLVIFDEASQIRVADAVGALGRSKAAVIVGDSMQMPPTSMFAIHDADEADDATATETGLVPADQDSILTECTDSNVAALSLTWHYRSRDERLIAFSNEAYYQGRLASFPTTPVPVEGQGLDIVQVGGAFDGGAGGSRTNRKEADAIVSEVRRLLQDDPAASIGIITLNIQQRDLITDLLEEENDPVRSALLREHDPIFVKNLENVQGDERDIILFSLAFSPDPSTGRLRLNFGPLQVDGGEKRLNVAITRARRRVTLFASFRATDIDLSRTSSRGLRDLREYMLFAEGTAAPTVLGGRANDLLVQEISGALTQAGLDVRHSLGLSSFKVDLAVRRPGSDAWVALLLDSPEWARRATVNDREALPRAVLKGAMGWPDVAQVWLPEWIRSPDDVVARVARVADDAALAEARRAAARAVNQVIAKHAASAPLPPVPTVEPQTAAADATVLGSGPAETLGRGAAQENALETDPPEVVEHRDPAANRPETPSAPATTTDVDRRRLISTITAPSAPMAEEVVCGVRILPFSRATDTFLEIGVLDNLRAPENRERVLARLEEVIEQEGPIEGHRLAGFVGRSFGLEKVRMQRAQDMLTLLPHGRVIRDRIGPAVFVWPCGVIPADYDIVRIPCSGEGPDRSIGQVPAQEIVNAAKVALGREGEPLPVEELVYATKTVLGYGRLGAQLRGRINDVLLDAIGRRDLIEEGMYVQLP